MKGERRRNREIRRNSKRMRGCGRSKGWERGFAKEERGRLEGGEGVKAGGSKDGIGRSWVPDGVSEQNAVVVARWYSKGVSQTGTEAEALRV